MTSDLAAARPATDEDLEIIARLGQMAVAELETERGGALMLHHDLGEVGDGSRYQQALRGESERLIVGTVDEVVVGFGRAVIEASPTVSACLIEELYVHPDARGVGVAARMLTDLRGWAADRRCEFIESHVLPGNRAAKNFFERLGMVTRKMRVSVDL